MAVELWAMRLERPLTAEETAVLTALLPSGRRARLERIRDAARAAGAALCLLHLTQGGVGTVPLAGAAAACPDGAGKTLFPGCSCCPLQPQPYQRAPCWQR